MLKPILCALATLAVAGYSPAFAQDGYCMTNGTTTGGQGGPTVTVTNLADFGRYVGTNVPYIVQLRGSIASPTNITVKSNKTILGLGTNATFNGTLYLSGVSNVVVQNLFILNDANTNDGSIEDEDGMSVLDGTHHVWVDHCTFSTCLDGELDITKQADFVTVSWSKFLYTTNTSHNFVNLIGSSDTDLADTNKLRVTWHHNWWSTLCVERMPRVRFGRIHMYNNYFNAPGNNYCIRASISSEVFAVKNVFENVDEPFDYFAPNGKILGVSNAFINCSNVLSVNDPVFTPPYTPTMDETNLVAGIVTNNAGAGRLLAGFTASPTNGTAPLSVTFTDSSTGLITNRFWNFGDSSTTNTTTNSLSHVYNEGTYTVTLIVTSVVGSNASTRSNYIVVNSGLPPSASFTGSPTNGTDYLEVTFTDTSTGYITNRFWDFGDNSTTNVTTNSVVHTYAAGTFTVTLIASGPLGVSTNTQPNYITVLSSPSTIIVDAASLFGSTTNNLAPSNSVAVLVVDTGTNGFTDPQPGFSLSLGAIWGTDDKVVGLWDLGDSYINVGEFGFLDDHTVVAYTNGIAVGQRLQLYWFPSLTLASNTVGVTYYGKYTDTNSPPLDSSAEWKMPAGGSTVQLQFYTASWGGSNPDAAGLATLLTAGGPPLANFTASPTNGVEPLSVTFTDTSTGTPPLSLTWILGDNTTNTTADGASFGHAYAAGTYTVTLIASNAAGTSTLVSNNLITVITPFQAWQWQYFSCTTCAEAQGNADPDGDGQNNSAEFLSGTSPTNNLSALRIISAVQQSDDVLITWATAGGRTNAVQATAGDANGGYTTNFTDITTAPHIMLPGSGDATTNYTDAGGATNVPARYYRVRLVP